MAAQSPDTVTSPRILIVRLSAIGDVIHGMPIACALRARFPRATWVGLWRSGRPSCSRGMRRWTT